MNIETRSASFITHDHITLKALVDGFDFASRPALLFVHGLNEHKGRYKSVVDYFSRDYNCFRFDLRGHGESPLKRSHVEHFSDLVNDVKCFVDWVKREYAPPQMILVGHSMGGQITLNYLAQFPEAPIDAFITSSPNIRLGFKLNALEKKLGKWLNQIWPTFPLPNHIKPSDLSHDPKVIFDFKHDPLVNKTLTARLGHELVTNQDQIFDCALKISIPALMLHSGADKVCAKEGSEDFFKILKSPDKTLKIYEGAYHELFNDFVKEAVFADMFAWLKKRF